MKSTVEHLVFVFGTLKEGFPNFATNRGTRVPGSFTTEQAYPLYLVGDRYAPWLVERPGHGLRVAGQLFRVDEQTLAAMDKLERVVEPDGYRRLTVNVRGGDPAATLSAFAYLKPAGQLEAVQVRLGPLSEYSLEHAALYRPRRPVLAEFQQHHIPAALALWERSPGVGLSDADQPARLAAYLARNPGSSFVAIDGSELVATILCGHDGRRGLIHHLVVDPAHQRKGLARSLLRAGLTALRQAHIDKCHLLVFKTNEPGLAFWRAVGAQERVSLTLFSVAT